MVIGDSMEASFTSDSMILWTIRTFKKNRKKYSELLREKVFTSNSVRLSNKEEVESFPELVGKLINE